MITEADRKGARAMLNKAKADHASRKKSSNDNLYGACLDGAKFYSLKPVSVNIRTKDINFRRKPMKSCCICETQGGTFYIENGKAFCPNHKYMMDWPESEKQRFINQLKNRSDQNVKE